MYVILSETFLKVVDKHASSKFLEKIIHSILISNLDIPHIPDFRLRNKFWKNPLIENERLYKKQRNEYISYQRKCTKSFFSRITKDIIVNKKTFWKFIKSFFMNKSFHVQNDTIQFIKIK